MYVIMNIEIFKKKDQNFLIIILFISHKLKILDKCNKLFELKEKNLIKIR